MQDFHVPYTSKSEEESTRFLERDFTEAFAQIRHYDEIGWDIVKFSLSQMLVGVASSWTIYALAVQKDSPPDLKDNWSIAVSGILFISFCFSVLAIRLLSKSRVYFVRAARYINEHRSFFLSTNPIGFANKTRFYMDFTKPDFYDFSSTQLISISIITLNGSLILGFAIGILSNYFGANDLFSFMLGIIAIAASSTVNTFQIRKYLLDEDKKVNTTLL
jgi:hypothetical protein